MKKLIFQHFIVLLLAMAAAGAAAQNVVGGNDVEQPNASNIAHDEDGGATVDPAGVAQPEGEPYIDPNAIAQPADDYDDFEPPEGLMAGRRNPIYYFGHNFSTLFIEISALKGADDAGLGLGVAYVPEVWGGYVTFHEGRNYRWIAAGAEYRLSTPWQRADWHLYGGVAGGDGWGGEIGVRLSADADINMGKVAFFGGSLGLRATSGGVFITGGVSLGFSAIAALALLIL